MVTLQEINSGQMIQSYASADAKEQKLAEK